VPLASLWSITSPRAERDRKKALTRLLPSLQALCGKQEWSSSALKPGFLTFAKSGNKSSTDSQANATAEGSADTRAPDSNTMEAYNANVQSMEAASASQHQAFNTTVLEHAFAPMLKMVRELQREEFFTLQHKLVAFASGLNSLLGAESSVLMLNDQTVALIGQKCEALARGWSMLDVWQKEEDESESGLDVYCMPNPS